MDMPKIGKSIAALRKGAGFTQETLAERLGITPQAVSKWETGAGLPEASLLIALAELFRVPLDDIIRVERSGNDVEDFIRRSQLIPERRLLRCIPRIDRWNPPEGCDMWYSFPAMIAAALCGMEAAEADRAEAVTLAELNERFRDVMHVTGVAYHLLWNDPRHLIEELWNMSGHEEMADRAMRYYGRDYIFLTEKNSTPEQARRLVTWSLANGRPVMSQNLGGMPEYSLLMGYESGGDTLIGWSYCGECAVKTNDQGMFVNPGRWDEQEQYYVLAIGGKTAPALSDRDTIDYALAVLDREDAVNPYRDDAAWGGDAALRQWLAACDTTEHTVKLFTFSDIYTYALYQNSIYTQQCMLAYMKKLCGRSNQRVHDAVNQITIAVGRLENDRRDLEKHRKNPEKYAESCRKHIEFILQYRRDLRGWLGNIRAAL